MRPHKNIAVHGWERQIHTLSGIDQWRYRILLFQKIRELMHTHNLSVQWVLYFLALSLAAVCSIERNHRFYRVPRQEGLFHGPNRSDLSAFHCRIFLHAPPSKHNLPSHRTEERVTNSRHPILLQCFSFGEMQGSNAEDCQPLSIGRDTSG